MFGSGTWYIPLPKYVQGLYAAICITHTHYNLFSYNPCTYFGNGIYHVPEPNISKWPYSLHLETQIFIPSLTTTKSWWKQERRSRETEQDQEQERGKKKIFFSWIQVTEKCLTLSVLGHMPNLPLNQSWWLRTYRATVIFPAWIQVLNLLSVVSEF